METTWKTSEKGAALLPNGERLAPGDRLVGVGDCAFVLVDVDSCELGLEARYVPVRLYGIWNDPDTDHVVVEADFGRQEREGYDARYGADGWQQDWRGYYLWPGDDGYDRDAAAEEALGDCEDHLLYGTANGARITAGARLLLETA